MPADAPAPTSPGGREVRTHTGLVQKAAQTEAKLKRKFAAANYWYERSLEKVAASETAVKHHRAKDVIKKLSRSAETALERYESSNTRALMSHVELLKVSVLKHEARVEVREAKLRSLRRRLRKRRLLSLCRWHW